MAEPSSLKGVPSPCINVCRMDERGGLCTGCHRTLDEIAAWSTLDDDARRAVWALIGQRIDAVSAPPTPRRSP